MIGQGILRSMCELWSKCKSRVHAVDCTTMQNLIQVVIQGWCRDSKIVTDCSKPAESEPHRVKMMLK